MNFYVDHYAIVMYYSCYRPKKDIGSVYMKGNGISSREISMAFTGSLLGAGFVSGQELMQFFAVFGSFGLIGMVFSMLMFLLLSSIVMKIAKRTGITSFDQIIVKNEIPWLRALFGGAFIIFLFGLVVIMIAGAGALFNQVFGLPVILGNTLMAVCVGVVALWEARGVLTAFGITVPLLILVSVITGILSLFLFKGTTLTGQPFSGANPLLGNWVFSTFIFVSYNMMAAISILVPIARDIPDEKAIHLGMVKGVVQLSLVFLCILLPLILHQSMLSEADLPMLTLAENIHPALGIVYALLLFCGMFGSALSCLFGVAYRIRQAKNIKGNRLIALLVTIAFLGSIAGFKELISIILPVFGYIGFFAMIGITTHYLSLGQKVENSIVDS